MKARGNDLAGPLVMILIGLIASVFIAGHLRGMVDRQLAQADSLSALLDSSLADTREAHALARRAIRVADMWRVLAQGRNRVIVVGSELMDSGWDSTWYEGGEAEYDTVIGGGR